jgi:lipopolysaccharide transport system ATP-binding protein
MSDTVIRVENLSKKYVIGHQRERYTALRDVITNGIKSIGQRFSQKDYIDPATEEFWALKDISFEIKQGDRIGIIGRNGAGKSTLLKILSRITEPTTGKISIKGRVASLLEVGTGFHPELTGRENIYLNGAILGMDRSEIKKKFDEIIAFAEIEKFLDTPVKRYSSGMYVRLAFAVAAHLEPEILIVDEVLAVGDTQFQEKCLGKMKNVSEEGRTVIFVSHNIQAISTLTQKCIFLNKGKHIFIGDTYSAINNFMNIHTNNNFIYFDKLSPSEPKITKIELKTSLENNVQIHGQEMQVIFEITTPIKIKGACLSFQIFNSKYQPVIHLWTFDSEREMCRDEGVFRIICKIPHLRLYIGNYTLTAYFAEPPGGKTFQIIEHVCPFEVVMYGKNREFDWNPESCIYIEDMIWKIQNLNMLV